MTSRRWVYSGVRPSNSAKELAAQPGFLRLRPHRLARVKPGDTLINWGVSDNAAFAAIGLVGVNLLNGCYRVGYGTDKLKAFQGLMDKGINCVEWTTDKLVAQSWLDSKKHVVVRNKLTGHSGEGIVIIAPGEDLPAAPLYTKYIFKDKEYRVHVCRGKVIDTQQKIRDPDREVTTWKIRSHDNGFIFARNNIIPDEKRDELAVAAVAGLGLDFGAVDVLYCKDGTYWFLEVNTAPGLEGQTVQSYAEALSASQG